MMGRELSGRSYPEIGVYDGHHPTSHHQNDPEKLAKLTRVNAHHAVTVRVFPRPAAARQPTGTARSWIT